MSAPYDRLLGRGFGLLVSKTDAPTITTVLGTAQLLSSPIGQGKDMQEHGYWPKFNGVVELTRADYLKLGIVDRSVVTYVHETAKLRFVLRVIGIEDDGADPCVKLTLKAEPGGKEG